MLTLADPWSILLLALILDALLGDPAWLYRAVPHPVALIGQAIAAAERRWNDAAAGRGARLRRGAALTLVLVLGAGAVGALIEYGLTGLSMGWAIEALLASILLAGRGLFDHVTTVAKGLELDLEAGRAAVARIVGRDPQSLDEGGVARAAVESAAENFSDGVVAPVFWFAVFGLGGLAAYKALNTLDSMIGHRSERYEAFGKAAARLDDLANWLPARLGGLLLAGAALLLPGADGLGAWRAMRRDAPHHRSPDAGWPEAAMAGALGFALAGPRRYASDYGVETIEDSWMGSGRTDLRAGDIRRALRLYLAANALLAASLALLVLVRAL
jgi:adenosylcobinamide-phosphate synthase